MVVFILNTASPWIIPEKFTAPQHTRFILPSVSPYKILRLYCVAVFFFSGKLNLESFISHLNVIPCHDLTLSVSEPDNAAAQTGAGTSFGANGDQHTRAVELSTYFCVLTIRKQLPRNSFERSGRGQEPSRGHKFSILENFLSLWDCFLLGRACPKPCRVTIKFIIVPWTEYNTSFDDTLLLFLQKSNYL